MSVSSFSLVRMVPMFLVMGTIFSLSHTPAEQLQLQLFPHVDKVGHFCLYALLALTVLWAVNAEWKRSKPLTVCIAVLLFCMIYGVSDEFHQLFIPGRDMSGGDLIADFLGSCSVVTIWGKRQSGKS